MCLNFIAVAVFFRGRGGSSSWENPLFRLEDVMHLAMPMLVNSTVPANEVDMSIELALMTSEMTSLAFSAWHIFLLCYSLVLVKCVYM